MLPVLLLATALLRGPDPEFFTPRPAAIRIAGDTVWLHARESHDDTPVSACYLMSTRTWCPVTRANYTVPARPALSTRNARLLAAAKRADDAEATAWVLRGGTLWAAFPGFSSEGEERRGVLAAIDTATRRIVRYRHAAIDFVAITDMVAQGNTLWLGSVSEGEYGLYGGNGLIRVDLSGPTPRFAPNQQQSAVPRTNEVLQLGAGSNVVAIITTAGPAVRVGNGAWDWRYWSLGVHGERIGHALTRESTSNPDWMLLLGVARLGLTSPAPVVRAFKERQWTFDNPDWLPTDSIARQLIAAGALPTIRATLARNDSAHAIVVAAAGFSRDRTLAPLLQARLRRGDPEAALALFRLGDPAGMAYLRRQLDASIGEVIPGRDLGDVLARSRSPEIVTHISTRFSKGVLPEGESRTINGELVALPFYKAVELLRILEQMDIAEAKTTAQALKRRFPQLTRTLHE